MPRARNIKPSFFKNEELVELPFEVRLLFIGLWTLADREGRMEDRPKRIKMEIFPADSVDVDAGLDALGSVGFLTRYEADGKRFIAIHNFAKHQHPHHRELESGIPAPETNNTINDINEAPGQPQASPGIARLNPESPLLNPETPLLNPEVFTTVGSKTPARAHETETGGCVSPASAKTETTERPPPKTASPSAVADLTDWQPSEFAKKQLRQFGIPPSVQEEVMPEFRAYWQFRADRHGLDHKFIRQCQRRMSEEKPKSNGQGPPMDERERKIARLVKETPMNRREAERWIDGGSPGQ